MREDLTVEIRKIVEDKGLSLFDIDYPTLAAPTLRIYVWKAPAKSEVVEDAKDLSGAVERRGVTLDECAQVSRVISEWFETANVEGSDDWLLEVSSPGVNRRLRAKEHFESAVGERVKLKVKLVAELQQALGSGEESSSSHIKRTSIVGEILEVNGASLILLQREQSKAKKGAKNVIAAKANEENGNKITIPLTAIEEARVEFLF